MEEELDNVGINDDGYFEVDFDPETGDATFNPEDTSNDEESEDNAQVDTKVDTKEDGFEYNPDEESEDNSNNEIASEEQEEIDDSEDINPLQAFTEQLAEKGMVLDLEEGQEITSDEELFDHFQKSIDTVITSSLENANKASHGAVTHFLNGGTVEEFIKVFGNNDNIIPSYKEEDITDNDSAKKEIAEAFFKSKGFSGKKLKKYVDSSVDLDEDSEFLEMQEELFENDKKNKESFTVEAKKRKEAQEAAAEEYRNKVKESIVNTKEFIPGRKLDKKTKEGIYENAQNTLNKINKDLSKYVPILSYLDHYGLLDGNFDKVIKETETKTSKSLSDVLRKTNRGKTNKQAKDSRGDSIREAALYSIRKKK